MRHAKNPLCPIEIDDYPKLSDYVLSVQGLLCFHSLKRNYVLGKELSLDEYNKLRLLYVCYATANRNFKEVFAWQDVCMTLNKRGIFERDMYQSKEDLKDKLLILANPEYQSGLYGKYVEYVKENMNPK